MNLDHAIDQLKAIDGRGGLWKRRDFARSLLSQYDARGSLSPKQEEWVNIIIKENLEARKAPAPAKLGLDRVIEIFEEASEKLKYPKLVIQLGDGSDLKLSRAGPKSRYNGEVQLTDGLPYGQNRYYGRVTGLGELVLTGEGRHYEQELHSILKSMTTDLGAFARMYGLKSGNCCFCRKELTAGPSLTAGYGPICAGNYGLPWGEDDTLSDAVDAQIAYDEGADIDDGAKDEEK